MRICLLIFLFMMLSLTITRAQAPFLLTVDSNADSVDANPGDGRCLDSGGRCTLRAAIGEANATPVPDVIIFALPAASTIFVGLGEIVISSPVELIGPGARRLAVAKSSFVNNHRIFRVAQNASARRISIRGLSITLGNDIGGAICIESGNTVIVSDVSLTGNRGTLGAAIYNEGILTLQRSFIGGNGVEAAANHGGGLYNAAAGTASVYNTTMTANLAGDGGAIFNAGSLRLVNSTISANRATAASSILANGTAPVVLMNTIIGRDNSNGANAIAGVFQSAGNNIVSDARDSEGLVDGVSNDRVGINNSLDPMIGPAANNGGQTDTMLPLTGSPAIDAGNSCVFNGRCAVPLDTLRFQRDQRFLHRQAGPAVDVGAGEVGSAPIIFPNIGFPIRPQRQFSGRAVITNTVTNTKTIRSIPPTGIGLTPISSFDVEIVEVISKRAGQSSFTISDPDSVVIFVINGREIFELPPGDL